MGDDRKHRKAKDADHGRDEDQDHGSEDGAHGREQASGRDSERDDFKPSGLIGEAAKKIFTAGVTAAFMTEESIRGYLSEVKLPKELLTLILQGASKSKDELTSRVGKEVIGMIQKIDFVKEASRFAETHKFKITAEIEIQKKEDKS